MKHLSKLTLLVLLLAGCKSTAYSWGKYEYLEIVGHSPKIPTFGEDGLHLPPGKYIIKAYKGQEVTYITYEPKDR